MPSLVGSEMCIRDRGKPWIADNHRRANPSKPCRRRSWCRYRCGRKSPPRFSCGGASPPPCRRVYRKRSPRPELNAMTCWRGIQQLSSAPPRHKSTGRCVGEGSVSPQRGCVQCVRLRRSGFTCWLQRLPAGSLFGGRTPGNRVQYTLFCGPHGGIRCGTPGAP